MIRLQSIIINPSGAETVRETNARPLANASAFLAGQVENSPG